MIDQLADDPGVFGRRVSVSGGMNREAEAGIVGDDAAELAAQADHDLPVEKGPVGVAVQ